MNIRNVSYCASNLVRCIVSLYNRAQATRNSLAHGLAILFPELFHFVPVPDVD